MDDDADFLDAIEMAIEDMTPGPWEAKFDDMSGYDCMTGAWTIYGPRRSHVAQIDQGSYGQKPCTDERIQRAESNALGIALMHNSGPAIIAEIRRLRGQTCETCCDWRPSQWAEGEGSCKSVMGAPTLASFGCRAHKAKT